MTYRLISLSGLIHVYTGEAKEYPKKPNTSRMVDEHSAKAEVSYEKAVQAFESQCVLVEDQRKAKILIWDMLPCDVPFEKHLPDRTLYTVEAPEMERVNLDDYEGYWPPCDVEGCNNESCNGGGCWRETGYWSCCSKHSQEWREGKPQPQMKTKSIEREACRGKDGIMGNNRTVMRFKDANSLIATQIPYKANEKTKPVRDDPTNQH